MYNHFTFRLQINLNLLLKQAMQMKKIWNLVKLNIMINICKKPLIMLILNIILLLVIRIVFMKEIYAEGTPWIGLLSGVVINDLNHAGLVQGVDGEWYDPNDTVEEHSSTKTYSTEESSSAESDYDIANHTDSEINEDVYRDRFMMQELCFNLSSLSTQREIFNVSIKFVQDNVPPNIWATEEDEITDADSCMNKYLDKIKDNMLIQTQKERDAYIAFQAAATVYNAGQFYGIHDNPEAMYPIFQETIQYFQ